MPAVRQTEFSNLREMMQRLGLDPAEGVVPQFSLSYLTAVHGCASCPSKRACRSWLDRTPGPVTFAPRFCPNAGIFFELHFDHDGHPAAGGAPMLSEKQKAP